MKARLFLIVACCVTMSISWQGGVNAQTKNAQPKNVSNTAKKSASKTNNVLKQAIAELPKASSKKQEELKATIKTELEKEYDRFLAKYEKPIRDLDAPIKKLEAEIAKLKAQQIKLSKEFALRKEAKEDLVKLKLDSIWYDAIGLSWPDPTGKDLGSYDSATPSINTSKPVSNQTTSAKTIKKIPAKPKLVYVSIRLPGMTWTNCATSVRSDLTRIKGVTDVETDTFARTCSFRYPSNVNIDQELNKIVKRGNPYLRDWYRESTN